MKSILKFLLSQFSGLFLILSDLLYLLEIRRFLVDCNQHVNECYETPDHECYGENIFLIEETIESHILDNTSENRVNICESGINWEASDTQLNDSH